MAGRFSSTDPGAAAAAPGAVAVRTSLVRTPTVRSRAESAIKVALFLAAILSVEGAQAIDLRPPPDHSTAQTFAPGRS